LSLRSKHITVFEHETLRFDKGEEKKRITKAQFEALRNYYGEKGVPFFTLCYNGVRFNEFVGVLQVGNTVIEVLPKIDKVFDTGEAEFRWRDILIGMLRVVSGFEIKSTSSSNLKIRPNTILDLYFEMFLKEVEYLIRIGLIKKYRKIEENVNALKGSIIFSRHIQKNYIHQERFFVNHTIYDYEHKLHLILYKTIHLLKEINTNAALHSRIGALLLNFPEMPDLKVNEHTFDRIVFDNKTSSYKKAISIARLILLQYHPDLSKGRNHVLALMFDMNLLWERFVYISLRKNKESTTTIKAQYPKSFWKPEYGRKTEIKSDIVISNLNGASVVIDTKWKVLSNLKPSSDDLQQMYVYHEYYDSKCTALVYPGLESLEVKGNFMPTPSYDEADKKCKVVTIAIPKETRTYDIIRSWQQDIKENIWEYLGVAV